MTTNAEPAGVAVEEEEAPNTTTNNTLIPPLTSPTVSNQTSCPPSSVTSSHYLLPNEAKDKVEEDEEVTLGADKSLDMSFDYLDGGPEVGFVSGADAEARRRKRNLTTCGFGHCRPRRCWRLANAKTLLVALSSLAFLQGLIFHGFIKVFITSLERRFELSSSQSGLIASAYDLTSFPVALPLSFFGGFGNKPVYVGVAAASLGVGSFIFAIPHFATGPYEFGEYVGADTCQMGLGAPLGNGSSLVGNLCDDAIVADQSSGHLSLFLWVFILAQFFLGCGGSILYTVGMAFLDENVSTADSPVYLAIFLAFSTLGPVVGYFASGQLLKYYVDIDAVGMDDVSITPEDPRWVGAWWIGFILSGCLALLLALPIAAFPRELPGHKAIQAQRVQETKTKDEKEVESIKSIKDLPRATLYLLKNPVFDYVVLAHAMNIGVAAGVSTFVPKFVQFQFNKTASEAAFIVGTVAVPGAVGGQLLGASIVKKLKLKIPGVLKLSIIFTIISCVATVFFFLSCPQNSVAGISEPYPGQSSQSFEVDVLSSCNEDCSCSASQFDPVCGSNGLDYFSPCHAGCTSAASNSSSEEYSQCSCVLEMSNTSTSSNGSSTSFGTVKRGHCEHGACGALIWMLILTFIFLVFHFSNEPTTEYMVMRCIPESQRTFGLGIEFAIIRLLGSIPAPIIFGLVIDSTCQIWQEEDEASCDESSEGGSCWFYDVATLGFRLFLATLLPKILSAVFFLAALYVHHPSEEDEKDANGAEEKHKVKEELKTTLSALEEAQEASTEEKEVPTESPAPDAKEAPVENAGEAEGEEKEPMITKDPSLNVGMEVIEEGEEENVEEEKAKSK